MSFVSKLVFALVILLGAWNNISTLVNARERKKRWPEINQVGKLEIFFLATMVIFFSFFFLDLTTTVKSVFKRL